jgi:hypothetical protein
MNNRKIIYEPEKITSEEIKQRREFDNVISSLKKPPSPFWKLTGFWGTIGTSIIALLIYNNYFLKTDENQNNAYDEKITQIINDQTNQLPNDTKCLHPISEDNDVPFESFEITGGSDQTITLKDGSVISISSNSFLTSSNAPIEIKARTFRSKSEAFLAGVPMDYDDQAFESAGMIELRGLQNGKIVQINPEHPIKVSLSLYKDPSTFNFYQLDDNSGRWTEYPVDYENSGNSNEELDELTLLEMDLKITTSRIKQIDEEIATIEFPKRRDFNLPMENSNMFNLKYDPFEFPELEELGNVQFEALPGQSNYQKVLQYVWSSFELNDLKNGDYEVIFSNNKGLMETLNVRPVLQGKDFDKAFTDYYNQREAKLKKRNSLEVEKKELIEANKERNQKLIQLQKEHEAALIDSRNLNNIQYEERSEQRNSLLEASAEFNTTSWGLFNSDKPISYPDPIGTPSTYTLAGKSIIPNEIYVFDLKKDVRYSYGKGSQFVESLGMNNNETIFIVMGDDNQVGYFKASSKKEFQSNRNKTLTVINRDQINVDFFKRLLDEERIRA